jgi:hypothetical protein
MKNEIEDKLDRIADIWNDFIWDYNFCSRKIKFNADVKTNYFGDILGYFKDTIDIVFTKKLHISYPDKFSFTISFLQAIYIQQDFTQEMLEIFKTGIDKGDLKQDSNYYINRELRNELVGHPIRKFEGSLTSSTLFSYQANADEIQYLRYHKDNNFKFESKTDKINDIQERHREFLNKYFDIILTRLKAILDDYLVELDKLDKVIKNRDFDTVLKLVELYFEAIFKSDFIYDKASLTKIYARRDEHIRYKNFIDKFYNDLTNAITDKRAYVKDIFERTLNDNSLLEGSPAQSIEIIYSIPEDNDLNSEPRKETYHYEIGKIATKRNPMDFDFFGGMLRTKCQDNELVLTELKHMESNIFNEIEYYTSLRLICSELKE